MLVRMGQQVACLLIARLPLACELADRPELWHRPVVVAHPDAPVVWSASPAALADGVEEGQRLSEAVGRCPTLVVLDGRPARYEATDAAVLNRLEQVAPGVEPAGLGVAYVDIAGLRRAYAAPSGLHEALLECAARRLRPRLGVAPTKFAAFLAASAAQRGPDGHQVLVVGADDAEAFVDPFPVSLLPTDPEVSRRLRLVGITTVGELRQLPRKALLAQFGPEGDRLAKLLAGHDQPVRHRLRPEVLSDRLELLDPLANRQAVLAAGAQLLEKVLARLRRRGRVARQVALRAETERGQRWTSTVTLREPHDDRQTVWLAVAPVLERAELPGPVQELSVELRQLRPARGWQGDLLSKDKAARTARQARITEGLRQMQARYGRSLVGKMAPLEPGDRIPERRWALVELEP